MIETPVAFKGAPGSPYTRKMMAMLRYRRIPYRFLIGDHASRLGMPKPKVELLPTFYLPNDAGEMEAVVDSTPLIRRFEAEFSGRNVLPPDPAVRFVNDLLEDYGDEWLTKAMFHYRWYYQPDIEMAGKILPLWRNPGLSAEQLEQAAKIISERQISRLYVVGSNDTTAPVIEESYHRLLATMDELIQSQPFLMGSRPGSADFAFYAQLTQLARFDPTPQRVCLDEAPRVFAWTDVMDDLSGLDPEEAGWLDIDTMKTRLGPLLQEVGRTYVPAQLANAAAASKGEQTFDTEIDGKPWTQPVFPYQVKCLQSIRASFEELDANARQQVERVLDGTGCERLLG